MEVTLKLGNSTSQITGLTSTQMNALRKVLSYRIDSSVARYLPNPIHHVKYCIDKKGVFASGLEYRVREFLKVNAIQFNVISPLSKVHSYINKRIFKGSIIKPYPAQLKALEAVKARDRGTLSLPTGTGKSHVICMILQELKLKTLIVVPTLELKSQLTASLKASLTTMEGITVENIDSSALLASTDHDCLIIDECHHAAAKTYQRLNKSSWSGITRRYCLTATPFRNNTEETLLFEGIAGRVIYELSYSEAITNKYIVPVECYYYTLPKIAVEGMTYAQVYSELVVDNAYRNEVIALLMLNLNSQNKSTLCLVKEIRHGEILAELTGMPFVNGQDEDSRKYITKFNKGEIRTLIATEGVMGEGVDSKPAEFVIIAGGGKAKSSFMQKCGRAVRNYPGKESAKVILFKDKSHKYTLNHFKIQCKIIKEQYKTDPMELDL